MKYAAVVAALAGSAFAAPVEEAQPIAIQKRDAINYVQNYNGNLANFQYNQGAGTYSASWNNPGDFVIGLGWTTGSTRSITYTASYTTNQGSYLAQYGWINSPLTEYYVVDNYSYDPCSASGTTQVGTVNSDGSDYKICKHTQTNQPSIVGTATFGQFFSVRTSKRSSGTITTANHFNAWKNYGFSPSNFNYQVMAVEAFGGQGSASVSMNLNAASSTAASTAPATSATKTCTGVTTSVPTTSATSSAPATTSSASSGGSGGSAQWGQCGGQGWTGPTTCVSPYKCTYSNPYYSQCI